MDLWTAFNRQSPRGQARWAPARIGADRDHRARLAETQAEAPAAPRGQTACRRRRGLGHRALGALLALALTLGCANVSGSLLKAMRKPGERLTTFPDAVWKQYDCDKQKRPFFAVEKNELRPREIKPGGAFNHRMVYVMCPHRSTQVVRGLLRTRVRFKGSPIVRQADDGYELKPGRWTVDSFIRLPEMAEPGIYAYEIEFESPKVRFEKSLIFVVRAP